MKKLFSFLLIMLLAAGLFAGCGEQVETVHKSIFSRPTVERVPGVKKNWLDVDSFVCYYGAYTEDMNDFDVAICESRSLGEEGIRRLNEAGVWTICYITIGEDDSLNVADGLGEGGYASYYLYDNGVPMRNNNWNSYFVDAGNPVWQAKIIARAREIIEMGADGFFLDTLDTVDVRTSSRYPIGEQTIGGMVSLIKLLKETFPQAKIVANRGFTILQYIAPYIDGLMFESFNTTYNFNTQKADELSESAKKYNLYIANFINTIRQQYYFPVFALDYINDFEISYMAQEYYNNSWTYDFIPYLQADILLSTVTKINVRPTSERGINALQSGGPAPGAPNSDTSADNIAYTKNGAIVNLDSWYDSAYERAGTSAVNDGYVCGEDSDPDAYATNAWASSEEIPKPGQPYQNDHYIEFSWTSSKSIKQIKIYWSWDNGAYYSSQKVVIQAWLNEQWTDIHTEDGIADESATTVIVLGSSVNTTKIRIVQPAGYGPASRPGLMWVSEVQIYSKVK